MACQRAVRGGIGVIYDSGELFGVGDLEHQSDRARQTKQRLAQLHVGCEHGPPRLLFVVCEHSGRVQREEWSRTPRGFWCAAVVSSWSPVSLTWSLGIGSVHGALLPHRVPT